MLNFPLNSVTLTASHYADGQHQQCHLQFKQQALQVWSALSTQQLLVPDLCYPYLLLKLWLMHDVSLIICICLRPHAPASGHMHLLQADFLSLDMASEELCEVRGVILDPSCSGSGTRHSRMDHLLPSKGVASEADKAARLTSLAAFQVGSRPLLTLTDTITRNCAPEQLSLTSPSLAVGGLLPCLSFPLRGSTGCAYQL